MEAIGSFVTPDLQYAAATRKIEINAKKQPPPKLYIALNPNPPASKATLEAEIVLTPPPARSAAMEYEWDCQGCKAGRAEPRPRDDPSASERSGDCQGEGPHGPVPLPARRGRRDFRRPGDAHADAFADADADTNSAGRCTDEPDDLAAANSSANAAAVQPAAARRRQLNASFRPVACGERDADICSHRRADESVASEIQ